MLLTALYDPVSQLDDSGVPVLGVSVGVTAATEEKKTKAEIFQYLSNRTLLIEIVVPTLKSMSNTATATATASASSSKPASAILSQHGSVIVTRLLKEIADSQEYWSNACNVKY